MYGEAVRELRERKGWTQQQLAVRVGCSLNTIQKIEYDRMLIHEPVIVSLLRLGLRITGNSSLRPVTRDPVTSDPVTSDPVTSDPVKYEEEDEE